MSEAFEEYRLAYLTSYPEDDLRLDDIEDAFNAGRAYQREVDAKIAESAYGYGSTSGDAGDEIAQTIREQKID